jgi:hypothetical protein
MPQTNEIVAYCRYKRIFQVKNTTLHSKDHLAPRLNRLPVRIKQVADGKNELKVTIHKENQRISVKNGRNPFLHTK